MSVPEGIRLESGVHLAPLDMAYEYCGTLNADRSNTVLVLHAFSGSAHAAGYYAGEDPDARNRHGKGPKPGWWDFLIGPGKAIDTDRFFVICVNVIGSCYGSTGPSSIDPSTGTAYGPRFPLISVRDMVRAQKLLLDRLGIERLFAVIGGSMGGKQALLWSIEHPDRVGGVIAIATTWRHTPQQIAFNHVGRTAILSDRDFAGGDYYGKGRSDGEGPSRGLDLARRVGMITYLSPEKLDERFGREGVARGPGGTLGELLSAEYAVEEYLEHQGVAFTDRFDANSYLVITKAMDDFELVKEKKRLPEIFRPVGSRFLVISFTSDWLYPASQSEEIVWALRLCGKEVSYIKFPTIHGHDAFLIEWERRPDQAKGDAGEQNGMIEVVRDFLARLSDQKGLLPPIR